MTLGLATIHMRADDVLERCANRPGREDLAYDVHCRLARIFGDRAPRPWTMDVREGGILTIRGYMDGGGDPVRIPVAGEEICCRIVASPTARQGHVERDVYLLRGGGVRTREAVYADWLADQVARRGGGEVLASRLVETFLRDVIRLTQGPCRRAVSRRMPVAVWLATIRAGEDFAAFLRRGVGRQRAFGLGFVEVIRAT